MTTSTDTAVVIFARMSSSRLPGKSLTDIGGQTVLGSLIDRMAYVALAPRLIVATSDGAEDDAIAEFCRTDAVCRKLGVEVFRGDLVDVLGRAAACARHFGIDPLVRISGDSPFMDPAVIDRVIARHDATRPDMTSNRHPRSFPPGITVEAISRACMDRLDAEATATDDREHITTYAYKHADRFRIENVSSDRPDLMDVALTVDTPEDLAAAREIKVRLAQAGDPLDYRITAEMRRIIDGANG